MEQEKKIASLPVASDAYKAQILAAFARIEDVPCLDTLIDRIPEAVWETADEHQIEAGSENWIDETDLSDHSDRKIA